MDALTEELASKDTKRRLQGLEALAEALRVAPPPQPASSWHQAIPLLVRTLRDNNFKICRASLGCLESLVGHVDDDIVPFLSMITPAVVECLGNSKPTVQEKGVDLLLAISSPAVSGAGSTICSLEAHFRHRNWRVRESLVAYLGRTTEVDGAGVLGVPATVVAGLIADALNDSASQVRQEALTAAARVSNLHGLGLMVGRGALYTVRRRTVLDIVHELQSCRVLIPLDGRVLDRPLAVIDTSSLCLSPICTRILQPQPIPHFTADARVRASTRLWSKASYS